MSVQTPERSDYSVVAFAPKKAHQDAAGHFGGRRLLALNDALWNWVCACITILVVLAITASSTEEEYP
jgi:hypothetical protein